jgi:hypothetical protein
MTSTCASLVLNATGNRMTDFGGYNLPSGRARSDSSFYWTQTQKRSIVVPLGLTPEELQAEIARRMTALDEAQDDAEHLGPYGDLLRLAAQIAFQRAADLIDANNRRLSEQLAELGLVARQAP